MQEAEYFDICQRWLEISVLYPPTSANGNQGKAKSRPAFVLLSHFTYAQVIKHQRRRRTVKVECRMLCGDEQSYSSRIKQAKLSCRIYTSSMSYRKLCQQTRNSTVIISVSLLPGREKLVDSHPRLASAY